MIKVLGCIVQEHDLRLVALSACICVLGCFTTISLMARSDPAKRFAFRWIVGAAAVFGCSVWSLHFVAMLAFMPDFPMSYALTDTAASIVVAAVGALMGLSIVRLLPNPRLSAFLGGALLGTGVAGMHYLGVQAMRLPGLVTFDRSYVLSSLAISVVFGIVSMSRARDLTAFRRKVEVSGWLTITICGLHFTGMTALTITPGFVPQLDDVVLGSSTLAFTVGVVSLVILLACLTATLMEQHLSQRTTQELERMRLLGNLAHEVLLIYRDDTVLELNNAGIRLFGAPADQIIGTNLLTLFAAESIPVLIRRNRCDPAERRPEELLIRTTGGVLVPVEISCQQIVFQGKPATAIALRDLTDHKRDEERIRHLAHHDALTDLPNRFFLQERLTRALDVAAQQKTCVAVVYVDLDRFKPVNDLLGHAAGDALLIQAAKRLGAEIQSSDTLARIGGDEFVLVVTNAEIPQRVSSLASRLIDSLARPFEIDGQRVEIGASVGVSLYPSDGATPETLLRAADMALYRVKENGRGTVHFFEASMDAELQTRRRLEQELAHATDRGELELFYQPILNARSGEVESFEALLRWNHPQRGLVPPSDFIPIAEHSDLMGRIGRWVIDQACRDASQWTKPWRVAVNVSPSQFRQTDVPAIVATALAKHGLPPNRLTVEITEGVFIENASKAVEILSRLRSLGVRLALDDFGTGYSSLNYLQLFTFDKFKIDRSFVQKLDRSGNAFTIIKAIINLGHNLGLAVTVEGVETMQQQAILRSLNCDQMQGYLFGRPAPVESLKSFDLDAADAETTQQLAVRKAV